MGRVKLTGKLCFRTAEYHWLVLSSSLNAECTFIVGQLRFSDCEVSPLFNFACSGDF